MENIKENGLPKINSININKTNPQQNKIIRSKSKNIYTQQKHAKNKIKSNAYAKPKISQNNNNFNNKQNLNKININNSTKNCGDFEKNSKNENDNKNSDLYQLKLLKEENIALKLKLLRQDNSLKELHNLFIHNYNKINSLRKKYSHYKRYLEKAIYAEDESTLKEKMEEEMALKAVEQQIMNEICPNPDQMSYEQLLQLEEEVGNVNKGLSKEKINEIPSKPFHMALFEDNSQCIICMENFNENELVKQLLCGHIFHGDCIDHWLTQQKNCPFCKAECVINKH